MDKVFVLTRGIVNEYSNEINVRAYKNREDAVSTMVVEYKAELNDWESVREPGDFEIEDDGDSARAIYESGRYLENHIEWFITECPIF